MFLRHDDKRSIVFSLLFLLFLSPTVFAQPNAEYNGSPDKKNNAIFFSNGLQCKYRDDVQGAIRNFEIALRYMPDDHASMYELSEQYIHTGELEEAFAMIQQAASLDPENKWYQIRLGQFYRNFGQYDDFIDLYENLTKKIPDDPELLSDLIDAYLIIEEYDKALEKLGLLETMVGQNEVLIDQQLNILKTQGNNKKLVTKLQELIQANPENPRYYAMLAQVYSEMGKNKDALKMYEKVEELNPNDPYINISLLEFYENNGNEDKAFEELVSAIRNMNLDLSTKMNVYDYWMNKHQNSANINEQARRCGEAFIEMYPDNRIGYLVLGSYYIVIEDAVRSKELYQKSLSLDSTDFLSWQNLIISESRLSENQAVRDHAVAAMQYYPMQPVFYWYAGVASAVLGINDDAVTYLEKGRRYTSDKLQMANFDAFLGDLYHQMGDEDKAFAAYERTLRNDPDNALVLNNYAYYLSLRNERLEEALEMAVHAVELEPNNTYYLDTYAWVLYQLGRYKEAEKQMKKCLSLDDHPSGSNLEHYGDILMKLGKRAEAIEYWNRAKQTGEYSEELEQKLRENR